MAEFLCVEDAAFGDTANADYYGMVEVRQDEDGVVLESKLSLWKDGAGLIYKLSMDGDERAYLRGLLDGIVVVLSGDMRR